MFVTISTIGVFETVPRRLERSFPAGTTVQELVNMIGAEYPEFQEILNSPAIEEVIFLLNGQSLFLKDGLFTSLENGDDIFIAPMTHGG